MAGPYDALDVSRRTDVVTQVAERLLTALLIAVLHLIESERESRQIVVDISKG